MASHRAASGSLLECWSRLKQQQPILGSLLTPTTMTRQQQTPFIAAGAATGTAWALCLKAALQEELRKLCLLPLAWQRCS